MSLLFQLKKAHKELKGIGTAENGLYSIIYTLFIHHFIHSSQ